MRKLIFYLFILKKIGFLLFYPIIDRKGRFFVWLRQNIENYIIFEPSKLRAKRLRRGLLKKIIPQRFINSDGVKLYSWFIKPTNNMPVILHLHGQAESILSHQEIAIYCLENGFGLFMLSYRGHYKSGGKASEQGIYNDAQAAIAQLKKLGIDKDKIIIWGHSLGTTVATETAMNNDVLGLILQSPIKEIKSAVIDVFDFYNERLKLKFLGSLVKKHLQNLKFTQKLNNIDKISSIKCPILIMHNKSDNIAPYQNSIEIAEKNPDVQLYISDYGSHWDAGWCFDKVFEFVNSLEYNSQVKSEV